jgi:excinuclease ABC subunit B
LQEKYNKDHGITPQGIQKAIAETRLAGQKSNEGLASSSIREVDPGKLTKEELKYYLDELNDQMDLAAKNLEFELAATLRDKIVAAKKLSKLRKK